MIALPGSKLRIRSLTYDDIDTLFALTGFDPVPVAESRAAAVRELRARIEAEPDVRTTGMLLLGVEAGGRLVGSIQARAPRYGYPPGVCELGISLSGAARGQGLGSEAVAVFTGYLFDVGWDRVQGSTAVDNVAMRRVLERAGYVFEGILRSFAPAGNGARADYALYAAIREDQEG